MNLKKLVKDSDLSLGRLFGLSLVGLPRVILHDLSLIAEGSLVNSIFVFVPMISWIGYGVLKKRGQPFLPVVIIGIFYGILLAVSHQLLWRFALGEPIQLGGNLKGLSPILAPVIIRLAAILSSLTTGAVVGVICGALATGINFLKDAFLRQ